MSFSALYDKGFIWNASNCECESDKLCDIGEYLDYENCKCRKRLIDKLVDECTETVEEVKLAIITLAENENSYKCSCYIIYTAHWWNRCLFCLFLLVFKKRFTTC